MSMNWLKMFCFYTFEPFQICNKKPLACALALVVICYYAEAWRHKIPFDGINCNQFAKNRKRMRRAHMMCLQNHRNFMCNASNYSSITCMIFATSTQTIFTNMSIGKCLRWIGILPSNSPFQMHRAHVLFFSTSQQNRSCICSLSNSIYLLLCRRKQKRKRFLS